MGSETCRLFDPVDVDLAIDQMIAQDDWVPVARRASRRAHEVRYDRAFEPVIRAGYLTVEEAVQRGDREAYTSGLESRFALPRDLAQRVTDGKTRLRQAVDECDRRHAATSIGRPVLWRRAAIVVALLALGFGFFGAARLASQRKIARKLENASLPVAQPVVRSEETVGPRTATGQVPAGRVERDESGWVTRIDAGHPLDALSTFCAAATPRASCSSLAVVELESRFPGRRLGRFTLEADERTWLVPIRRDNDTGRWAIGTGLRPIAPAAEPPLDEGESDVWPHVPEFVPAPEESPAPVVSYAGL